MKPPSFFVVADRGHMKAYQFKEAIGRGSAPHLVEELNLEEARLKYEERFTDQAGAFPSRTAPGIANSIAERMSLEEENDARICRHLAKELAKWLGHYKPESWGIAAPSEINNAILHRLSEGYRKNLIRNLKQDLVNVPVLELVHRLNDKISLSEARPVV